MKIVAYFPFFLLSGCLGDAALPILSSTKLPSTQIVVDLGGPDKKGNYHYYVHMPNGTYVYRFLGSSRGGLPTPTEVYLIKDGIYRIKWGPNEGLFFAEIDVSNSIIVEDSNPTNPKGKSLTE